MSWIRITRADNIPLRQGRAVTVGGHEIAIFNLGARFFAVGNRCPHLGGPLADGIVSGDSVVCPLHAWKVCLHSGAVKRPHEQEACTRSFPVQVVDGIVQVRIAAKQTGAAGFDYIDPDGPIAETLPAALRGPQLAAAATP